MMGCIVRYVLRGLWNSLGFGVGSVGLRVGWTVEWSEDLGIWEVCVDGFQKGLVG